MTWNRRRFLATSGAAAVGSLAARSARTAAPARASAALFLTEDDGLKPATYDRLPLEWHQARAEAPAGAARGGRLRGNPALRPDEHHLFHRALLHDDGAAVLGLSAGRPAGDDLVPSGPRPRLWSRAGGRPSRSLLRLPARRRRVSQRGQGPAGRDRRPLRVGAAGAEEARATTASASRPTGSSRAARQATVGEGLREGHEDRLGRRPLREDADGQDARGARALAPRLPGLRRDARLRARPAAREGNGPDRLRARRWRRRSSGTNRLMEASSATARPHTAVGIEIDIDVRVRPRHRVSAPESVPPQQDPEGPGAPDRRAASRSAAAAASSTAPSCSRPGRTIRRRSGPSRATAA